MSLSLPCRQEPDAARAISLDTDDSIFRVPSTLWLDHTVEHAGTASLHRLKQSVAVNKDRGSKEERMNTLSHPEIIGLDVSYDWLDIHCQSEGRQHCLPNMESEISELEEIASGTNALVCFEATGGHEWRFCELGGGRNPSAATLSGKGQGVRENPGNFGQDRPERCRIDRPLHGVPP